MRLEQICELYARTAANPNPGTVPGNLCQDFCYMDGTADRICKPSGAVAGLRNVQNAFWNRYKRHHTLNWLGFSWPDGLLTLDGPFPGFYTDHVSWISSTAKVLLERVMRTRVETGFASLNVRCDKLFFPDEVLKPMFSRRNGNLQDWMLEENSIASAGRVSNEWDFGGVTSTYKFINVPFSRKLLESAVSKQYILAAFLYNCKVCLAGSNCSYHFGLEPPTLRDYLSQ